MKKLLLGGALCALLSTGVFAADVDSLENACAISDQIFKEMANVCNEHGEYAKEDFKSILEKHKNSLEISECAAANSAFKTMMNMRPKYTCDIVRGNAPECEIDSCIESTYGVLCGIISEKKCITAENIKLNTVECKAVKQDFCQSYAHAQLVNMANQGNKEFLNKECTTIVVDDTE